MNKQTMNKHLVSVEEVMKDQCLPTIRHWRELCYRDYDEGILIIRYFLYFWKTCTITDLDFLVCFFSTVIGWLNALFQYALWHIPEQNLLWISWDDCVDKMQTEASSVRYRYTASEIMQSKDLFIFFRTLTNICKLLPVCVWLHSICICHSGSFSSEGSEVGHCISNIHIHWNYLSTSLRAEQGWRRSKSVTTTDRIIYLFIYFNPTVR